MLFKSFRTFVDGFGASTRRFQTASAMAERHDAHLTAVALTQHASIHAKIIGSDLIMMGGVTHAMIRDTEVPILMAQ